ncbi:MAG: hypothetical protein IJU31_04605 [Synergistaceae bacterium]|nr:hypothetical protein [Synergistaceae bacterium]
MIKVEKAENNILKVDNELYLKAQDNIIIAGLSVDDVKASLNALEHSDLRLFGDNMPRRLEADDFLFLNIDPKVADKLDEDDAIDGEELAKYVAKPLKVEFAFQRLPQKFLMSTAVNLKEAFTKEVLDKIGNLDRAPVKGGHIDLGALGAKSPLVAGGGELQIESLKLAKETKEVWDELVKQAGKVFSLTEEDLINMLTGPLSVSMNDNVTVEGVKLPAFYFALTGKPGAADKIFATFEKSQHFSKAQDGVLQVDSSLSPAPCFIKRDGDTLTISFAELENLSAIPELAPGLQKLMDTDAISAVWIDFAGIQSWIVAPERSFGDG